MISQVRGRGGTHEIESSFEVDETEHPRGTLLVNRTVGVTISHVRLHS